MWLAVNLLMTGTSAKFGNEKMPRPSFTIDRAIRLQ